MADTAAPDVATAPPSAFAKGSPVRRWLPWVLLLVVVVGALSVAVFGSRSAPTAEDRVTEIARTIKCPVCAGESVAESDIEASRVIKVDIAKRVQAGQSDDEIRAYYASGAGYDQNLLLSPPTTGINVLVWVVPVVALAVAIAFLVIVFLRWGQEASAHASEADKALVAEALQREHEQEVADHDPYGEGSSR